EDVSQRTLCNVEETWSYTVFLTSVAEYLCVKEELGEFDLEFEYARDVLIRFADWMLVHERPYLAEPDRLEFPNHTWTAQDLRKAVVLSYAYRFADAERLEL